jgi:hypothetical protein
LEETEILKGRIMSVNFEVSGLLVTGMRKIRDGSWCDTPRLTPAIARAGDRLTAVIASA